MKKIVYLIVAVLLAAALLAACNQKDTPTSPSVSDQAQSGVEDSVFENIPEDETVVQQAPTAAAPEAPTQEAPQPATQPADEVVTQPTTEPSQEATEVGHPDDEEAATKPTQEAPKPTQPTSPPKEEVKLLDYETFQAMSGAEQRAYQESFEDLDAFFEWYNAAKETYEKENPSIEIGAGDVIDMGDLTGNQG